MACMRMCTTEKEGGGWRDRYREIQKVICPSSPLRARNHCLHDRSPAPVGGDLYEALFIGNFNPGTDETPASQLDSQAMMKAARTHL